MGQTEPKTGPSPAYTDSAETNEALSAIVHQLCGLRHKSGDRIGFCLVVSRGPHLSNGAAILCNVDTPKKELMALALLDACEGERAGTVNRVDIPKPGEG